MKRTPYLVMVLLAWLLQAAWYPTSSVLAFETAVASGGGSVSAEFGYLARGIRVKVEGKRFEGEELIAEKIEVVEEDDDFEVEGPVQGLDEATHSFQIGIFQIHWDETTEFEDENRRTAASTGLANGLRVKVKFSTLQERLIVAETIRFYVGSADTDFEMEAPIDSLDPRTGTITLLSVGIRVNSKTEYPNIQLVGSVPESVALTPERGIRRDDDEPDVGTFQIGGLYLGGKVGVSYERTRELDLHPEFQDSNDWVIPEAELEMSYPWGEHVEFYSKLLFNRRWNFGDNPLALERTEVLVREAFVYVGNFFHPNLALQFGRQRFRDKREWVYDDQLDAVRLHFGRDSFKLEVSVAKGLFGPTGSRSDQFYLIARAEKEFPGRRYLSGYVIKRNDLTSRDEDPIWIGMASRGRITRNLHYWGEFSRMMGRRGENLLRGYGYDLGGTYRFRIPLRPSVSVGYAFGSGDDDRSDGVDGNFRQTRLNDNSEKMGGLKRYRYYGVLLEPELYNLKIQSIHVGLRPFQNWSLNLAFHAYRQAVASRRLGDSEILPVPNGRDPRLGKEYDLVFAWRGLPNMDLNIFFGVFQPGPAFRGERPNSLLFRPEFRYYF